MKRDRPRIEIPRERLYNLLVIKGLSTPKAAKELGVSQSTVYRRAKEYGIPLLDRVTATKRANRKYPKKPFNGNSSLKAYLLGDVGVQLKGEQILVGVSTTHPGMERLFTSLFSGWNDGQLYKYPAYINSKKYKGYDYILATYLHSTFDFLLKKPAEWHWRWTPWAIENHFWCFLAGFIDAEGCIEISKRLYFQVHICNKNTELLNAVRRKLQGFQFHPSKIYANKNGRYYFRVPKKREVVEILRKNPLRHPEKIYLKYLILNPKFTIKQKYELYRKYRAYIKQEIGEYVRQTVKEHKERKMI